MPLNGRDISQSISLIIYGNSGTSNKSSKASIKIYGMPLPIFGISFIPTDVLVELDGSRLSVCLLSITPKL